MQAGYVCCFADPNRAWNRSSPRQLGASVIAAAHIAQFQYIVKCVVGASSDMWAVTKTHRGSAMTLDEKIDETATHVAPYVLSIARVVIGADVHGTWDLEAVRISRADSHTRPVHAVAVRGDLSRSSAARSCGLRV